MSGPALSRRPTSPDFSALCRPHANRLRTGEMTLPEFRAAMCDLLQRRFGVARASLWRVEGAGAHRHLRCVGVGTPGGVFDASGTELRDAELGFYFEVLLDRGIYHADDVRTDPLLDTLRPFLARHGVTALLDTVFQINGKPFGVVCLEETAGPRHWTPAESIALRQAASAISLAIARYRRAGDPGAVPTPTARSR